MNHLDVTLTGGADQASSTAIVCRQAVIHNITGNSVIYIGGSTVSDSTYGASLGADEKLSLGPFDSGAIDLRNLYIKGTGADVVHILYVPF